MEMFADKEILKACISESEFTARKKENYLEWAKRDIIIEEQFKIHGYKKNVVETKEDIERIKIEAQTARYNLIYLIRYLELGWKE